MPTNGQALDLAAVDIRALDHRAVQASLAVVQRVRSQDLDRPTPCSEWNLADLLAHMTVQHRGFQAASLGLGGDLGQWTPPAVPDPDPVAAYAAAAEAVLTAFAADGVLDRRFALPEISTEVDFPAAQAISFHVIDYVVHGWDVARSLGEDYVLEDELAPVALRIAELVPAGPARERPSAAFGRVLPGPAGTAPLERILRLLGRSPNWPDRVSSDRLRG